jgi:amino acid adenylation domain-containing protein
VAFMLEDAAATVLLTQSGLVDRLPHHPGKTICLDTQWNRVATEGATDPAKKPAPKDLAYVIYTSGSTGKPKGAMNTHRGVCNRLLWMQDQYRLSEEDGVLQKTPFSFDVSVWEFFWPLLTGARLVMAEPGGHRDPAYLVKVIREQRITVLHFVPSMLRAFLEATGVESCESLRHVICSGEALPYDLQQHFFSRSRAQLHNLYGPTEAAVDVTHWTCRRDDPRQIVPIGRPVANTRIYVLDGNLQPAPVGIPGELHIGGIQVGLGYHGRPELTAEKFIPDPFSADSTARLYKTGDLCRWLPDGTVEYLGRTDFQVKIRGLRIELGEIEETLRKHPAIREVAVVAREVSPGDQRLIAYVTLKREFQANVSEAEPATEYVSAWQAVFDQTYADSDKVFEKTFNTIGWNSSYTGKPLPAEEMQVWVDSTVERILALQPQDLWEIGAGTGLLLFRLAPACASYRATDFSSKAVRMLREQIADSEPLSEKVVLAQAGADDFTEIDPESFDVVVLNSVVQYFPGIAYLLRVLEGAVQAVKPGGAIFLGDLLSKPLLRAFHAGVQLEQAPDALPLALLQQRIQRSVARENELAIAPVFFNALQRHLPAISQVEIQLKRGHYHNELSLYRYDVVLHIGATGQPQENVTRLDWLEMRLSLSDLYRYLDEERPKTVNLTNVPNARLQRDVKLLSLLADPDCPFTAGALRAALEDTCAPAAIEPEEIWALGESLGYSVQVGWPDDGTPGMFQATFILSGSSADQKVHPVLSRPDSSHASKPWNSYATNPLQSTLAGKFVPEFRSLLEKSLPEYMTPSAFVLLDELPLTPRGKLDRKALPRPEAEAADPGDEWAPPDTDAEEKVAEVWRELLGLAHVGRDSNFFDLGGHSLLVIRLAVTLEKKFAKKLPVTEIFRHPTVRLLARYLDGQEDVAVKSRSQARIDAQKATTRRRLEQRREVAVHRVRG